MGVGVAPDLNANLAVKGTTNLETLQTITTSATHLSSNYFTTYTIFTISDLRLKTNIQPLGNSLDKLTLLQPVSFEWKDAGKSDKPAGKQVGLIAQDVEKIYPELVGEGADGYKTLNYQGLGVMAIEAIKELKAENDDLKAKIKSLEERLGAVEGKR